MNQEMKSLNTNLAEAEKTQKITFNKLFIYLLGCQWFAVIFLVCIVEIMNYFNIIHKYPYLGCFIVGTIFGSRLYARNIETLYPFVIEKHIIKLCILTAILHLFFLLSFLLGLFLLDLDGVLVYTLVGNAAIFCAIALLLLGTTYFDLKRGIKVSRKKPQKAYFEQQLNKALKCFSYISITIMGICLVYNIIGNGVWLFYRAQFLDAANDFKTTLSINPKTKDELESYCMVVKTVHSVMESSKNFGDEKLNNVCSQILSGALYSDKCAPSK